MPFFGELAGSDMQTTMSRIWTRITYFISYDDNRYTISCIMDTGSRIQNGFAPQEKEYHI